MSTQEKRRLERLKKELDSQQKKLDAEKRKYQRQLKELKAEQNKVSAQKRELNTKIKKFNLQQKEAATTSNRQSKRSSTSNTGIERKLREEIRDLKNKSEITKKQLRETRKDLDAATDEIKILKRKAKHRTSPSMANLNERKIKQARREIYNMKRRLKMAMSDLDKQAKYYESQLRRFKLDEQKWINRQREINKEQNIIIKYVFIDDITKLKLYENNNTKVRISTSEGYDLILRDISITNATEVDKMADDVIDKLLQEIEFEFSKRKRRVYKNTQTKIKSYNSKDSNHSIDNKDQKNKKKKRTQIEIENNMNEQSSNTDVESANTTPMTNIFDDMKDFEDIYSDVEHEDFIDGCFHQLMKEISEKITDLHKINVNEDIEVLLDNIKERHSEIYQTLTQMQYEYVDEIPDMNTQWQNEIYALINNGNNTPVPIPVKDDNILKLQKIIAVLNNEQPKALLDEIIENEMNSEWKNVFLELNKIKLNDMNEMNGDKKEIDDSQLVLCNELINEMKLREMDLESVQKFNENDMEPQEEIDNILENVSKRHVMEMEKIMQIIGNDSSNDNDMLFENIKDNNSKWEQDLIALINNNKEIIAYKKQNGYCFDELNGRIADLLKLIDIYDMTKSTKMDLKALKNNFNSFVISICDRHEYNHNNNTKNDKEAIENDKDWKDNMFLLATNMTGLKVSDVTNDSNDNMDDDNNIDNDNEEKDNIEFDIKNWWLNKDENRNDTVDDIIVNEQQQCGELYEAAIYLTRLLYISDENEEKEDENDVITSLYFPIPLIIDDDNQPNKHNIISTLYDGVILCKFINKLKSDYIDERVIHSPNAFNPFPINDSYVYDNMQLLISSVQSLGIQLKSYNVNEWLDSNNWVEYVIELINILSSKYINDRLSLRKHKELVRLVKNNEEDADEIRKLTGIKWLHRWINYLNNKPVLEEIIIEYYNNDIFTAMKCNINDENIEEFNINPELASNLLINKYKHITHVESIDLCNNNNKLQDLFIADLFEYESGLDKLSDSEKQEYKSLLKSSSKSRSAFDRFTKWINTALSPNITIINLLKDLSDGYIILKLIDKSKPGCVTWRNVRKKIRHKFDKVNNCNIIMKLCEQELGFSLVGMAGSDIVDMNEKFIISLLSQLMRIYQTRQLSLVLFKNATNKKQKQITDNDILQWVNLKINECDDAQSKPITSFKDRILSTCIFYCELLKAVRYNEVDLSFVNYDVKPLVTNNVMDKQKQLRLQNARYCITLTRRFGGELFVVPHHLCTMENKSILAVLAAIMTISITDNKNAK